MDFSLGVAVKFAIPKCQQITCKCRIVLSVKPIKINRPEINGFEGEIRDNQQMLQRFVSDTYKNQSFQDGWILCGNLCHNF